MFRPLPAALFVLMAAPALAETPVMAPAAPPADAPGAAPSACDRLAGFDFAPRVPGSGVPYVLDPAGAVAACEAEQRARPDDPYLRLQLGRAYLAADPQDPRAAALYASVQTALPAMALLRQGGLAEYGWAGQPQDRARAMALYRQSCAMTGAVGALTACSNLGLMLLDDPDPAVQAQAVPLFRQGCDGGDPFACMNLGYEYEQGTHLPQDLHQAVALYTTACDGADPMGCNNLGIALSAGWIGPADPAAAVPYLRRACDMGEPLACSNLGWATAQGWAGRADPEAAIPLYRMACDAAVPLGCENLAAAYFDGEGLAADHAAAAPLFEQACGLGAGWSCLMLGTQLLAGDGVARDPERARATLDRGCALGEEGACAKAAWLH